MSGTPYIAHLADDREPLVTTCGAPWQGWQAPTEALAQALSGGVYGYFPPTDQPRAHVDLVQLCLRCLKIVRELNDTADQRADAGDDDDNDGEDQDG